MNPSQPKHGLSDILSMLLPNEQQTLFLRACLWSGEEGCRAWLNWCETVFDTRDMLRKKEFGLKGLTPLLYYNLQKNEVAIESSLLTFFRTAQIYEEKRTKVFREISQNVLMELNKAEKRFLVVKGAALADAAFEKPSLRHCHDLDIVLEDSEPREILALIEFLDFTLSTRNISSEWENLTLVHQDGLPVSLHRNFFGISLYNQGQKEMLARCEGKLVADVPCQVLSPAFALLHVCGQAFASGHSALPTWASDSWAIIVRFPDLNWEQFIASARQSHLALPMFVMLGYLAEKLQAPIPSQVLVDLEKAASKNIIGQEIALSIARKFRNGGLKGLLGKTKNWQTLFPIFRWIMFPSLDYLRWTNPHTKSWVLPFLYVSRPVKYLARRFQ
jgi:hypothetical protein